LRFLISLRNKESHYALPVLQRMKNFEKRVLFIEKNLNQKKCKYAYYHSDLKGIYLIWDFDSNEEAAHMMLELPGREYVDINTEPIMEYDSTVKNIKSYFELAMKE